MINPDKIRMMTELALQEQKEGRKMEQVRSFFCIDYVGKHIIGAFFRYTVAFTMVFFLIVMAGLEDLLETADVLNAFDPFKKYLVYYIAGLIMYEILTFAVYLIRYEGYTKKSRLYQSRLKRLRKRYDAESNAEVKTGEAGRNA